MTLWQLKAFVTVAKEESFTKAGKVLHINQPSVSALVTGLQKELEVKLFEKLGIKPHLTEAGRRVLQLAESVLATIEKIPEEIDELKGLKRGSMAVGASGIAAATFLPGAIEAFRKKYPGIEISLKIAGGSALEKDLLDGNLDLAILGGAPLSPFLVGEVYLEEEVVGIAPPKHPLAQKHSVPLKLLAPEPLIIQEKGNPIRDMVEARFAKAGCVFRQTLEVSADSGARDLIRSAVAKGLGIAFISKCHVVGDVEGGRIRILRIRGLKLKRTMYITTHKNRQGPWLIPAFVDFLRDHKRKIER
jgi:DNA-binding transcriptional LysR family regulator